VIEKLVIRPARREDYERILEIAAEAWSRQGMNHLLATRFGIVGSKTPAQRIRETISRILEEKPQNVIVAELGGRVVGFLTFDLDHDREIGHISYNAVDSRYRNRGIGTRLVKRALEIFKERGMRYAMVFTWLDEAHAPARRVYEKCGFKPLMTHITYFMEL